MRGLAVAIAITASSPDKDAVLLRLFPACRLRLLCLSVCLSLTVAASAAAADRGFSNYDGDTLRATFRLENIDTPEIKGACAAEKKLALRAKDFTQAWLAKGQVTIQQTGIDKYGRVLARVARNGEDLGEALIAAGLARPWKGRRESWC
jgi:micrococcal nuclease